MRVGGLIRGRNIQWQLHNAKALQIETKVGEIFVIDDGKNGLIIRTETKNCNPTFEMISKGKVRINVNRNDNEYK